MADTNTMGSKILEAHSQSSCSWTLQEDFLSEGSDRHGKKGKDKKAN